MKRHYRYLLGVCGLVLVVGMIWHRDDAQAVQPGFVSTQGSKLMLDGQEYFAKGLNMHGSFRYVSHFFNTNPAYEVYTANQFWQEFDETKIDQEFQYYRNVLDINTVRLFTPSLRRWDAEVQYHNWTPWFLSDGSINPVMRDRLVKFIQIAERNGIRVHLSLMLHSWALDWECRISGVWQLCYTSGVDRLPTVTNPADARYVEPGGALEQKYFRYLESLLPYLKDRPGVLGYEVDNEALLNWTYNGQGVTPRRDWYQDAIGSYMVRMMRKIRLLDPNHLIGTGEVVVYDSAHTDWWAWLSAEFGQLNDIHGLHEGKPYTIESVVDYLAPHAYNFAMADGAEPSAAVAAMRSRTTKPIMFGEFGYSESNPSPLAAPTASVARKTFLDKILALRQTGALNGCLLWSAMPVVDLPPGGYSVVTVGTGTPAVRFTGPPVRTITGLDYSFTLFTYDAAAPFKQAPLPEMQAFIGNQSAQYVAQTVPSAMTAGQQYPVSVTYRNNGTTAWNKAGAVGDYLYAYRIKSQNPADNTTWGISFVPIPSAPVLPGQNVTFSFQATAPANPGTYNFQWKMNQGGVGWFGDTSPNISVVVSTPTPTTTVTPTVTPTPTPTPTPADGLSFTIDGGSASTRQQLQAFAFAGSGFTPGGFVRRHASFNNGAASLLSPDYQASTAGMVSWTFTPICTTQPGAYTLWLTDLSSGRTSPRVTETVLRNASCPAATPPPPSLYNLREGDTVSAVGSSDPDIYIINDFGYKRLFLNPIIFSFYGHLGGWSVVKSITATVRDAFFTSGLFRNCETNDTKVYALEPTGEDSGTLHHVNMTGAQAASEDPDFFKKVFCINSNEFNWYPKSPVPYTSLSQVPVYRR